MKLTLLVLLLALPVLADRVVVTPTGKSITVPSVTAAPIGLTITNAWKNPGKLYTSTDGIVWWKIGEGTNEGWNTNAATGLSIPCYIKVESYYLTNVQESGFDQLRINGWDKIATFYSVAATNVTGPWGNKTLVLRATNAPVLFLTHQISETNQLNWTK